jgi:hypothetical protein
LLQPAMERLAAIVPDRVSRTTRLRFISAHGISSRPRAHSNRSRCFPARLAWSFAHVA